MSAIAARKARLAAESASLSSSAAEGSSLPRAVPLSPNPAPSKKGKRKAVEKESKTKNGSSKKGKPVASSSEGNGVPTYDEKESSLGQKSSRYFQAPSSSNGVYKGRRKHSEFGQKDQEDFVAFEGEADEQTASDDDDEGSDSEDEGGNDDDLLDESGVETADPRQQPPAPPLFRPPLTRGTWMPSDENCIALKAGKGKGRQDSSSLLVGLHAGDILPFVGVVHITMLKGAIKVSEAHLDAQQQPSAFIYAPKTSPIPFIEAIEEGKWEGEHLDGYPIDAARFVAVILISSSSSGIEGIASACPLPRQLFNLPKYSTIEDQRAASRIRSLSGFHPIFNDPVVGLHSAFIPPSQRRAFDLLHKDAERAYLAEDDDAEAAFTCLIRGPKRVGKSTFARHALHAILTSKRFDQVAFLETDLGQTEFGPPGMVSLHLFDSREPVTVGPSWCSLRIPICSHFVGDVTPRDDPDRYLEAIQDLIAFFHRVVRKDEKHRVPLLVNTQGWIRGLGADLIGRIEDMTSPTHIFDVLSHEVIAPSLNPIGGRPRLDADGAILGPGPITIPLEPAPLMLVKDRGPSAAEVRTRNLISYLYATSLPLPRQLSDDPTTSSTSHWNFGQSLLERRPLVVDVAEGLRGGIHILPLGAKPTPELQLAALNASLVAIVRIDLEGEGPHSIGTQEAGADVWRNALSSTPLPDVTRSTCLGYAIVRSIDVSAGQVHLITSTPAAAFTELPNPDGERGKGYALALVKGAINVPVLASLDFDTIDAAQRGDLSSTGRTMAGVPLSSVPYLDFPKGEPVAHGFEQDALEKADEQGGMASLGMAKRKVRRNIQRRSQR